MQDIDLARQTMFAELQQRSLDAEFDETFAERGSFVRKRVKNRDFWYYQRKIDGIVVRLYAGPVTDKAVTDRVTRFASLKSDFKQRQDMVRALTAVRLPVPDKITGSVVEALWKAGFFRLRGVLVGTVAYQCYAGLLGVKLAGAALMTQDADFAQFWGISNAIDDTVPPMLEVLQKVDPSFREMPSLADPFVSSRYSNAQGYKVEFLTPNRGSDDHQGKPARMKALGGAGAEPLRHLDFLIHEPERSVLLYGGGVPVTVPRAERYAVHKLIVAVERKDQVKSAKDLMQAGTLIEVLAKRRPLELAEAWTIALDAGPKWQEKLIHGRERLPDTARAALAVVLERAKAVEREIQGRQRPGGRAPRFTSSR